MGPYRLSCPHCDQHLEADESFVGTDVECPSCNKTFTVPAPAAAPIPLRHAPASPESAILPPVEAAPPAPVATPGETLVKVTGRNHNYSFLVPAAGWQAAAPKDADEMGADVALFHNQIGWLKIMVGDWALTFADMAETIEETYSGEVANFQVRQRDRATVSGCPAVYLEFSGTYPESEVPNVVLSYVFVRDGHSYQVLIGTFVATSAGARRILKQVAESFELGYPPVGPAARPAGQAQPSQPPPQAPAMALPTISLAGRGVFDLLYDGLADGWRLVADLLAPITLFFVATALAMALLFLPVFVVGPVVLVGLFWLALALATRQRAGGSWKGALAAVGAIFKPGFTAIGPAIVLGLKVFGVLFVLGLLCSVVTVFTCGIGGFVAWPVFLYVGYAFFFAFFHLAAGGDGASAFKLGWLVVYTPRFMGLFAVQLGLMLLMTTIASLPSAIVAALLGMIRHIGPERMDLVLSGWAGIVVVPVWIVTFVISVATLAPGLMTAAHAYVEMGTGLVPETPANDQPDRAFGRKLAKYILVGGLGCLALGAAIQWIWQKVV